MLTKEQILKADDMNYEDVEVEEWGGTVRVSTMTGTARDDYEASLFDKKGDDIEMNRKNMRAKLVARCIVDEKDEPLFTDKDVDKLGRKSAKALDKVYEVAARLNGLGVKEEEDLVKN